MTRRRAGSTYHLLAVDGPAAGRTFSVNRKDTPFDFTFSNFGCAPDEDLDIQYVVHSYVLPDPTTRETKHYLLGFSGALLPVPSVEQIQALVLKHKLRPYKVG